jgi:hypothetical protein
VHHLTGADDVAAKRLADALMPQTDAEDRNFTGEGINGGQRHARLVRRTGPGESTMRSD